jgi:tetratricopeptide (TPR) repeat protein
MVFLLHGEPGTGKSTLALQFAWDAQKDFDAVVFQTCGQRPLDAITAELVERLPLDEAVRTLPPDRQREAAKQWLRQRQSLLVLDDVWPTGDGKIEVTQLEPGPACSVLYTSRLKSLPGLTPRKQTSEVEKFTEREAEELFHTYLDSVFSKDDVGKKRKPLLDFAARVEMLPIAVAVGASLLRDKSAMALSKAVAKLNVSALADGEKNVNDLFAQAIESQPEREQKLLTACAVCVQEGFWLPLAAQIAKLSEDEADEAANALARGSLLRVLDRDRQRFQLHALLREQLRARAGTDGLAALQECHAAALEYLFKDRGTRWLECRECLEEIIPATDFLSTTRTDFLSTTRDDTRAGRINFWGYDIAEKIGELDAAYRMIQLQENLCLKLGDKGQLQAAYGNRALILYRWGRLEEALALHKKQEAICLELGNKDSLQRSYGNQANILQAWGRLEEAMDLHKKAEAIAIELGDKYTLQAIYGNQAVILKKWGRLEEALALHKKEEDICMELGNKDGLQRTYSNQAMILLRLDRILEALTLIQKSEAICIELGVKRDLAYTFWQWASLARVQGDRTTEKQKLQQALALFTELNMPRERDAVQVALNQLNSAEPPAKS